MFHTSANHNLLPISYWGHTDFPSPTHTHSNAINYYIILCAYSRDSVTRTVLHIIIHRSIHAIKRRTLDIPAYDLHVY